MKVLTTKIAKQFAGLNLIKQDMMFAGYAFSRASDLRKKISRDSIDPDAFLLAHRAAFLAGEPVLRRGGVLCMEDNDTNQEEDDCRAFFESGIVTYAKCFNSKLRTGLNKDIFRGILYKNRRLHDWIMEVRNQHIAHSDLKREGSVVSITLIVDKNYGKRPNRYINAMLFRRQVPLADKLTEMADHCSIIVEKYLRLRIIETGKEIGEQVLKMPEEQLNALQDLTEYRQSLEDSDAHMWQEKAGTKDEQPEVGIEKPEAK